MSRAMWRRHRAWAALVGPHGQDGKRQFCYARMSVESNKNTKKKPTLRIKPDRELRFTAGASGTYEVVFFKSLKGNERMGMLITKRGGK